MDPVGIATTIPRPLPTCFWRSSKDLPPLTRLSGITHDQYEVVFRGLEDHLCFVDAKGQPSKATVPDFNVQMHDMWAVTDSPTEPLQHIDDF